MNNEKTKKPFGIMDKLAYAAGDFGCNMSFSLKNTVQTFWLVFMAMETGLLSILLLVVQVWDAINDPLVGAMIDSDKRNYKLGKFRTYILIGAIGLLVAGSLMFIPLKNAKVWLKCILYIVGYVIWDACYTIANVPYGSMLSLITEDASERAQLSTWRSIGSMIGNILTMALLPFLIWETAIFDGTEAFWETFQKRFAMPEGLTIDSFKTNPLTKEPYAAGDKILNPLTGAEVEFLLGEKLFWIALVMGVIGLIAFLFMIKNVTIRVDENTVKASEPSEKVNILKSFKAFFQNRPAVGATLAAMGMFLGMQSAATASTIMFTTHFGMAKLSGLVTLIGFLPMVFFIPFIKKLVDKYGKKEASVGGTLLSLGGAVLMFIFPLIQHKIVSLIVFIFALCVFGLGMGIYTCVSWAFMADAIDYNEWKTGKREEGLVYSLHSFFRKLAQGIGPSIVLFLMGLLGYEASKGTIGQSAETALNMCWLVAGLYAFSAVLMFVGIAVIYNLDKKTLAQMNDELAARKAVEDTTEEVVEEDAPAAEEDAPVVE